MLSMKYTGIVNIFRFSRVIDNVNTVLSLLGLMLNATALIAFIKNGKSFWIPHQVSTYYKSTNCAIDLQL